MILSTIMLRTIMLLQLMLVMFMEPETGINKSGSHCSTALHSEAWPVI